MLSINLENARKKVILRKAEREREREVARERERKREQGNYKVPNEICEKTEWIKL